MKLYELYEKEFVYILKFKTLIDPLYIGKFRQGVVIRRKRWIIVVRQ